MRYTGKQTRSFEQGHIDPNTDNNSLMDNGIDPTEPFDPIEQDDVDLDVAPDIESGGGWDSIELEGGMAEQSKVENQIVRELSDNVDAANALDAIAVEMRNIISTEGRLSFGDIYVVNQTLKTFGLEPVTLSAENVALIDNQYVASQASFEGVFHAALTIELKALFLLERLIRVTIAFAKSKMIGGITKAISRANNLKNQINNSKREPGMKELSGPFIPKLAIAGAAPRGDTLIKNAELVANAVSETLNVSLIKTMEENARQVVREINRRLQEDWDDHTHPRGWTLFLLILAISSTPAFTLVSIIPALKILLDINKASKQILKVDPATIIPIFKMCPALTTVKHPDSGMFAVASTGPLFGGYELRATQIKTEVVVDARVPLNMATPAILLVRKDSGTKVGNMQALTSAQQLKAIDQSIVMLNTALEYYKTGVQRAMAYCNVLTEAFDKSAALKRTASSDGKHWAGVIYRGAIIHFSRDYLGGVINGQSKIAKYAVTTAIALTDAVEASMERSQIENNSNEDLDLFATADDNYRY